MAIKSALEVFPTLRRYAFYPRVPTRKFPVGYRPGKRFYEKQEQPADAQNVGEEPQVVALRTIYHDLGTVAFKGCTPRQIAKMGRILEKVVSMGGPAALTAKLLSPVAVRSEVPRALVAKVVSQPEHFTEGKDGSVPRLTPAGLIALCDAVLKSTEPLASEVDSTRESLIQNKAQVFAKVNSTHSGIHLKTDTGVRQLPLTCHVAWKATPGKSEIECDVMVSTRGKGDIIGHVQAVFDSGETLTQDSIQRQDTIVARVWNFCEREAHKQVQQEKWPEMATAKQIALGVWKLESSTWRIDSAKEDIMRRKLKKQAKQEEDQVAS